MAKHYFLRILKADLKGFPLMASLTEKIQFFRTPLITKRSEAFYTLLEQVNGKRGIFPTSYVSSMPECEGTKVRPLCSVDQLGFFCSILS